MCYKLLLLTDIGICRFCVRERENRLPVELVACKHEFPRLPNLAVRVLSWYNVYVFVW